jgi:23S rRNA (adenine2030-N6)-methyltransferase
MNYRHAFHAGNFADCFKHALLIQLLDSLMLKPTPLFVMDTHAGAGRYDLQAPEARRTNEATTGIFRVLESPAPVLRRYQALVEQLGVYPGSPLLIRGAMRTGDHLVCCELHPVECHALRRALGRDANIEVHQRSGWEAVGALLPPKEKRGLVFIDPPFEDPDEFSALVDGLHRAHRRFGHGVFAAWYPVKHMAAVRGFHDAIAGSGIRDVITVELHLRETLLPGRLNGCGLLVINPPYQFEAQGRAIADAVLAAVGDNEDGAGVTVARIANE